MDLDAAAAALAPRLIAYALARTACRATAEDIAQEALAALVRRWRRHGAPDSPDAFVFSIAKRRAGRANARRMLLAPLDALRSTAGAEPSSEQAAGVSQINRALSGVDQVTQRNASAAEELASTAEEMASQAESLQQLMSFFRVTGIADAPAKVPAPRPAPAPAAQHRPAPASHGTKVKHREPELVAAHDDHGFTRF